MLVATHDLPLFLHKTTYMHFQKSTLLFEGTTLVLKGAMYIQVVFGNADTQPVPVFSQ